MAQSILIVEDDHDIADLIRLNTMEITPEVTVVHDGEAAQSAYSQQNFDLVLLDVMLPGISGFDVCRDIRQRNPQQSILMLTSKTSETDRVLGLELGADDYMTKPFSIRELQARIRAQLRKANAFTEKTSPKQNTLCFGELMIDPVCHQIQWRQKVIEVTSTEFDLLFFLASHPRQVFSRQQLLDSVWGYHHSGYEHTVNSHINRLRSKFNESHKQASIIETVWGVGYRFNPDSSLLTRNSINNGLME